MPLRSRILTALLTLALGAAPLGALAQPAPQPETISGRVVSIDESGAMQLNDTRGFVDSVQIQPETIINPARRIMPGMAVTISGVNRGNVFAANRVTITDLSTQPAPPPMQQPMQPQQPPYLPQQPIQQPQQPPMQQPQQQQPYNAQPPAQQLYPPVPGEIAGSELTGTISAALDSKDAFVGQAVMLTDVASADGSIRGAKLYGTVTDVSRPGQGHSAQLNVHFDRLQLRNGTNYRIEGVVTQMKVATKNNALKEAGAALAGMLAGNAIMKTVFGASGGGIIGAAGGYLIASNNRTDVSIPAATPITVRVERARRQSN